MFVVQLSPMRHTAPRGTGSQVLQRPMDEIAVASSILIGIVKDGCERQEVPHRQSFLAATDEHSHEMVGIIRNVQK
ncbi:hypothetical protein Pcac1_g4981 [Phytophthora cactorum]|nr:hypothetical protein Pcac1_g4981 [Phytophthora cactorum]KAG3136285.1 hypothetical protein C6341_g21449 [Phytophthora cactorum]